MFFDASCVSGIAASLAACRAGQVRSYAARKLFFPHVLFAQLLRHRRVVAPATLLHPRCSIRVLIHCISTFATLCVESARVSRAVGLATSRSVPIPHNLVLSPSVCSPVDAFEASGRAGVIGFASIEMLCTRGGSCRRALWLVHAPAAGYGSLILAAQRVGISARQRRHRACPVLHLWACIFRKRIMYTFI